jgi:hypothetical protein
MRHRLLKDNLNAALYVVYSTLLTLCQHSRQGRGTVSGQVTNTYRMTHRSMSRAEHAAPIVHIWYLLTQHTLTALALALHRITILLLLL